MNGDYDPIDPGRPPRRSLLRAALVPGIAFLLGLGAMGYVLSRWDEAAQAIGVAPQAPPPAAARSAPEPRPTVQIEPPDAAGEPEQIVIDPDLARRVAALEQRIGQVGTDARAAVGNADRAEGLLVAFAARRALDRGVPLGFLESLLRERFGASQPRAVGLVILAAREPVTLQELQGGLDQLGPQLIGAGPDQGWWSAFTSEFGSLVTVRRAGTPSPEPAQRFARARRWLETGEVRSAIAEVQRMPGAGHARSWATMARRYSMAREALDTIETAALLEPRTAPQSVGAATQGRRAQPAAASPGPAARR